MNNFSHYRELNWSVIPLAYRTKKAIIEWKIYQSELAAADQCTEWDQGRFNVGIVTGRISGIFILDIDGEDGKGTLDNLEAKNGALPKTAMVQSGKGMHYYFRMPKHCDIRNLSGHSVDGEALLGIDIRADGGYIAAPPSVHPNGKSYEWLNTPWNVPLAEAPEWLLKLIVHAPATPELVADPVNKKFNNTYLEAALREELIALGQATKGNRNDQLNKSAFALGQLITHGLNEQVVRNNLMSVGLAIGLEIEEINSTIESGLNAGKSTLRTSAVNVFASTNGRELPRILIEGGGLSREATQAEKALIGARVNIFQRGDNLVLPIVDEVTASGNRKAWVGRLRTADCANVEDLLCQHAHWYKMISGKEKQINPPPKVAQILLSRKGCWNFSKITGVITCPTLRPDATLLSESGYDATTGLFLINPPAIPPIPQNSTKDDALKSLSKLQALLVEFPFTDGVSLSVALSAMITPIVRGMFPVAPLHVARASTPGTGKSYLFDISAAIAIGQPCPVIAVGRNEEETEKRLGATILAGQSIFSLDNVNGALGGDFLCQLIERPNVKVRILGKSELVPVDCRATVFATGNNLYLQGDMTRRAIVATMDANRERPELRQFNENPFSEILQNRGEYIAAVLTIILAYIHAGKPDPAPRLASFGEWSDTVRSALIWLGEADPVASMETARAEDPLQQAIAAVFCAIKEIVGVGRRITTAELIKEADTHEILKDALTLAVGSRTTQQLGSKGVGKWLSGAKGRISNNLKLECQGDKHGHAVKWWIKDIAVEAV
jgi:putative DNA primase/helicase